MGLMASDQSLEDFDKSLKNIKNGGILPYYIDEKDDQVYFLLGQEFRNQQFSISNPGTQRMKGYNVWMDFGGKWEPVDKKAPLFNDQDNNIEEKAYQYCLREMYEESHLILPSEKCTDLYLKGPNYVVFLVRFAEKVSVDMLDFNCLKVDNDKDIFTFQAFPFRENPYREKHKYQWFLKSDLHNMANDSEECIIKRFLLTPNRLSLEDLKACFIMPMQENMLYHKFIPFLRHTPENKIFKKNDEKKGCYTYEKVYGKYSLEQSSLDQLCDERLLHKQDAVTVCKWFTVLHCLLYYKKNDTEYEIYGLKGGESSNCYYYQLHVKYDTKDDLISEIIKFPQSVLAKEYDTKDKNQFFKDIYFQINVKEQAAYCAIEIKEPLRKKLDILVGKNNSYAKSFALNKKVRCSLFEINADDPVESRKCDKRQLEDEKTQIGAGNNNTKISDTQTSSNVGSPKNWLEIIKCYLINRYSLIAATGFFFLTLYYMVSANTN